MVDIDRCNRGLVSEFEGIPSAVISDVTENRTTMDSGLKPINCESMMAGSALTVSAVPGDNLTVHKAITIAEPGDVLVIDGDGYTETAYLGELMSLSCEEHDLAGIVVDGAIRDRDEIAEMDFPLYTRGVHPQGPTKEHQGEINTTISCGGVSINPADIVVGDCDGVSVVPANSAESILERAREKLDTEDDLRKQIRKGGYLYDIGGYEDIAKNEESESGDMAK